MRLQAQQLSGKLAFGGFGLRRQLFPKFSFLGCPFRSLLGGQPGSIGFGCYCLGSLRLRERGIFFRSKPTKLGGQFRGCIYRRAGRLKRARFEVAVIEGSVEPYA